MKKFNIFVLSALSVLLPLAAQAAATYTYECEPDDQGVEALCVAEPVDSSLTLSDSVKEGSKQDKLMFGALDANFSPANSVRPGVPPQVQSNASALNAIRTQEQIRQIEVFLRSTEVPGGTNRSGDVMAAGAGQ